METHYINHLQLFEVRHAADESVLPDVQGHPVVVRDVRTPGDIASRGGPDVRATLGAPDNIAYRTDRRKIDTATAEDLNDWIDFTAPVQDGADSATLVFRLRNSLLNTTLLHDVMLGPSLFLRTPSELDSLSAVWARLWQEIDQSVRSQVRPALQLVPVR